MTDLRINTRLRVLAGLIAFLFAALATRLWFMQVLATERYKQDARNNQTRLVRVPAPRGRILDANGNILVGNRPSLEILVNRQQLGGREEEVLARLSDLLGVSARELGERLDDPKYYVYTPVPIAIDVKEKVADYLREYDEDFRGVTVEDAAVRTYPEGKLAAHVLGYLGRIQRDQLKDPTFDGYGPNDLVGQSGIEAWYEPYLRGAEGWVKLQVDATGRNLGEIGSQLPQSGDDVYLTLDMDTQRLAEESLREGIFAARQIFDESQDPDGYLQAPAGAVVVLDPTSGAIKALASFPTYDPRIFVEGLTQRDLDALQQPSAHRPLLDRAIQGQYPPGSTYKPFTALSAMTTTDYRVPGSGVPLHPIASPNGSYDCPSEFPVPGDPNTVFHNWSPVNLGVMSLHEALVRSCDTVFYAFGWDYWVKYFHSLEDREHGLLPLQHDLRELGFGKPTGLDLPFEQDGRVPTPQWKASTHEALPKAFPEGRWLPGDLIQMMIGQGDTLVTPLQLATAYAAIANDGRWCVPHLGLRVKPSDASSGRRIKNHCHQLRGFTRAQIEYVRSALTGVVQPGGTAASAFTGFPLSQVPVAGKTGTAQVPPYQDYSWFAAMAPANDPQYVVVALVEQGGHGSTTAAPIVRHILEGLFGLEQSGIVNGGTFD